MKTKRSGPSIIQPPARCAHRHWSSVVTAALLFFGAASATLVPAQTADHGTVVGRVLNKATGTFLAGAEIRAAGTGQVVYSDSTGYFELNGLAAGVVRLQVAYAGLDSATVDVPVPAGGRATREIALTSAFYGVDAGVVTLDAFVVAGEREGKAEAVTRQRRAENIVNVIAADEFSNVAGGNIGEFLRNVPGVVIEYSGADPRTIRVRGMDPNLNGVTVDGMRMANSAGSAANRQFEIDLVSLNTIESVEVTKAPTPAQEADTGGGNVNMISKSAFAQKGRRVSYALNLNMSTRHMELGRTPLPSSDALSQKIRAGGNLNYSNSFRNNTLGVVFTANSYDYFAPSTGTSVGFTSSGAPAAIPREAPNGVFAGSFQHGLGGGITRRHSFSFNLDYKLSDHTTLFLYNQLNTSFIQNRGRAMQLSAPFATIAPGYSEIQTIARGDANASLATARTSTSNVIANIFSGDNGDKSGNTTNFAFGAKQRFGPWRIDTSGSFSQSTNHYHQLPQSLGRADFYLRGLSYTLNTPHYAHYPTFVQTGGPDLYNLANYISLNTTGGTNATNANYGPFTVSTAREQNGTDKFATGKIDVRRDFAEVRWPFYLKSGVQYREQHRDLDTYARHRWVYVGPDGVKGTADDVTNYEQFLDATTTASPFNFYRPLPFPSITKVTNYFKANPQAFFEDRVYNIQNDGSGTKKIVEKVYSAYLMGDVRVGRLGLLLGARAERTQDQGRGPGVNNKAGVGIVDPIAQAKAIYFTKTVRDSASYGNLFPNAQARLSVGQSVLLRASYTETIGRQNLGNIIPGVTISNATLPLVTENNPALKPQYFKNYEVSAEYYLKPVGIFSAGVFYKTIRNYTRSFDTRITIDSDFGYPEYIGGTYRTLKSVGNGEVKGLEYNYSQLLDVYATWLQGFGVFANVTRLETKGDYGAVTPRTLPLDDFVPKTVNAGISYRRGRFDGSVKYNFKSETPLNANNAEYAIERATFDVSAKLTVWRKHRLFVEIKNVGNMPDQRYLVQPWRISTHSNRGGAVNFGVQGNL